MWVIDRLHAAMVNANARLANHPGAERGKHQQMATYGRIVGSTSSLKRSSEAKKIVPVQAGSSTV